MSKLSPKQDAFCREYLIDFNASAAARRAGYKATNAKVQGSQNLAKANIQERIAELKAEVDAKKSWDATTVRDGLYRIAQRAEDEGQLGVARSSWETMAKIESMMTEKHELTGRQQISFNIKTGKK